MERGAAGSQGLLLMRGAMTVATLFLLVLGVGLLTSGAILCVLVVTTGHGQALLYSVDLSTWWKGLLIIGAFSFLGGALLARWNRRPS